MNTDFSSIDDYGISIIDDDEVNEKIRTVFSEAESGENVLIGNITPKRISESVDECFWLSGFHIKNITFRESDRSGKYIILFGRNLEGLCSYSTTSDKIYEALMCITAVYGDPSKWKDAINVRIRMNTIETNSGNVKAYSLEVIV